MVSDDRQAEDAETPTGSVFGNLPRDRPGTRSPRRAASPGGGARRKGAEPEEPGPPQGDERTVKGTEVHGIEDLAWAGVAIAAEAATLGVRLASRAIEAVRGPTES